MKNYIQSPLPFQGQKRRFLKLFKEALKGLKNENYTFVDLFGGSGLLSHQTKLLFSNSRVIWNDYDNFQQRINSIPDTNRILANIREIVKGCPEDKKMDLQIKERIIELLSEEKGFVDYVTLSSSLLFSGKFATSLEELKKDTFYVKPRKSNYNAEGFLKDVERTCEDYMTLFLRTKDIKNVIYLVDPPYLSTDCSTYTSNNYWKLSDYLDVLTTLQNTKYFYFTSNKSQVVELCEWMSTHSDFENPFKNSITNTTVGNINFNSSYTDIMCFKIK